MKIKKSIVLVTTLALAGISSSAMAGWGYRVDVFNNSGKDYLVCPAHQVYASDQDVWPYDFTVAHNQDKCQKLKSGQTVSWKFNAGYNMSVFIGSDYESMAKRGGPGYIQFVEYDGKKSIVQDFRSLENQNYIQGIYWLASDSKGHVSSAVSGNAKLGVYAAVLSGVNDQVKTYSSTSPSYKLSITSYPNG